MLISILLPGLELLEFLGTFHKVIALSYACFHILCYMWQGNIYPEAFEIVLLQDYFLCILYISETALLFSKVNIGNLFVRNTAVNKVKGKIQSTVRLE